MEPKTQKPRSAKILIVLTGTTAFLAIFFVGWILPTLATTTLAEFIIFVCLIMFTEKSLKVAYIASIVAIILSVIYLLLSLMYFMVPFITDIGQWALVPIFLGFFGAIFSIYGIILHSVLVVQTKKYRKNLA